MKMELQATIKSKYLNQILDCKKTHEFRQFSSIELTDENGQRAKFSIKSFSILSQYRSTQVMRDHDDIPFEPSLPISEIEIGELLYYNKDIKATDYIKRERLWDEFLESWLDKLDSEGIVSVGSNYLKEPFMKALTEYKGP
ncbi:MAG: hypothetical protein WC444_05865 [Candidatus Paceibacterota bacterium]|jgi:hypothetical protein